MRNVGSYEAKTHLAELLDKVAGGESITITKHGNPVAMLVPIRKADRPDPSVTVQRILEFRARHRLDGLSIRGMIEEGRR